MSVELKLPAALGRPALVAKLRGIAARKQHQMQALVLLLTLHGLRVSEAIERMPADIDTAHWILSAPD